MHTVLGSQALRLATHNHSCQHSKRRSNAGAIHPDRIAVSPCTLLAWYQIKASMRPPIEAFEEAHLRHLAARPWRSQRESQAGSVAHVGAWVGMHTQRGSLFLRHVPRQLSCHLCVLWAHAASLQATYPSDVCCQSWTASLQDIDNEFCWHEPIQCKPCTNLDARCPLLVRSGQPCAKELCSFIEAHPIKRGWYSTANVGS